jgi:calcineurin-like phosphoesterase family protein
MATYLIADPHFFHASIIKMCNRPFATVAEMNDVMAAAIRKTVRDDDDFFVVGDFAHRAEPSALKRLFDSLPGRKHLIVGNHDDEHTRALGWASVRDIAFVSIEGQRCVLSHYALRSWPGIRKGALMLHGHHHGRLPGNSQQMDIGVDVMGFAPVRLNTIKAYMAKLPPLVDPEGGDDFEADGVVP